MFPHTPRYVNILFGAYDSDFPMPRGRIAECLPWEILKSIYDQAEEFPEIDNEEISAKLFASRPLPRPEEEEELASIDMPSECHFWPEVPLEKHQRNLFLLSMTHVCRNWRIQLIGLKRLWCEIAFSTETMQTYGIRLATHFLARVRDHNTPLHIYAGLPFSFEENPSVRALLLKLRDQTHRWERFYYWGRVQPYRSYLDLPAPRLRYFSDNHDLCHLHTPQTRQFFEGHTPVLRSLVTSTIGKWQQASLADLRVLDLWDCTQEPSMKSLLNVLHCTPRLEEINITSPNLFLDCPPDEVTDLLCLKNLKINNPDFYMIIGHLIIPNVQVVHLFSKSIRGADGSQIGHAFRVTHPFVGLTRMRNQLPMFSQQIQIASVDIDDALSRSKFVITLTTGMGTVLSVELEYARGLDIGYLQRSVSALAEMPFLFSSTLSLVANSALVNYDNPIFLLNAIENLVVEGDGYSKIVTALSHHPGQPQLLPNLRFLCLADCWLEEGVITAIQTLLRSRNNLMIVLDPQARDLVFRLLHHSCVIEGVFISPKTTSTP